MAFQRVVSTTIQSKLYLSSQVACDKYIADTPELSSLIVDTPGLNVLVGRVPIKVARPIKKGDSVHVLDNSVTSKNAASQLVIGIALENNYNEALKLVECVLKL